MLFKRFKRWKKYEEDLAKKMEEDSKKIKQQSRSGISSSMFRPKR